MAPTAYAEALLKTCGELRWPERQAGASILPGKVNPVLSEAASQVAMPALGHEGASRLVQLAQETGRTIRETALAEGRLSAEQYAELTSPEAVTRLGSRPAPGREEW